jgi:hypothetical protein
VGALSAMAIIPRVVAGLNCASQKMRKSILSKKRNGNARPKKAGIQKSSGEMYFAETEISRAIMVK